MKKLLAFFTIVIALLLTGCFNSSENDVKYQFYNWSLETGYEGTYEDWLDSLIENDGQLIEFVVLEKTLYWKNIFSDKLNLISDLNELDGKEIELSTNATHITWRYVGDDEWKDLVELSLIKGNNGTDGKSAYELAVELGYQGTLKDWLTSLQGLNGTDGKSAYELAVELGYQGTLKDWLSSLQGLNGTDGKEIELSTNATHITWRYVGDDEWKDLVELSLIKGNNGTEGKSAYELAVELGYQGTLKDWLTSLQGLNGTDGKSAYELAVELGYQGTLKDWLTSLQGLNGTDGKEIELSTNATHITWRYVGDSEWKDLVELSLLKGNDGTDGKSAYETAVELGYQGTIDEWLSSLQGLNGTDGKEIELSTNATHITWRYAGDNEWKDLVELSLLKGNDGTDGKSAYELAAELGYQGTIDEWLSSLVGIPGKEVELFTNQNTILWRHAGDDEWTELIDLNNISGKTSYQYAVDEGYEGTIQEWLLALKQEDNINPQIGISDDGYWVVNNIVTTYKADADDSSLNLNHNNYLIINGKLTTYRFIDNDSIVDINTYFDTINKIIKQLENTDKTIQEALGNIFVLEKNVFKEENRTLEAPSWNYTTSIFSGWGGSIGRPNTIDTIHFKVRARDVAITQIQLFITENDKNGEVLFNTILDVYVAPYTIGDIYWTLDEVFTNSDNLSLYFTYCCNQLTDMYSNVSKTANIKEEDYQAIATYSVSGKFLDSPKQMTNVYLSPTRYLYVELGHFVDTYVFNDEVEKLLNNTIEVFLPDKYYLAVDDNFQLFYRGVVMAVNPYNYGISISCSKGKTFPRYYEWKPTLEDVGEYKLTLYVHDDNGKIIGQDETTLVVSAPTEENKVQNVLCIGDSLTAGGYWVSEAYRRICSTGGTPNGLGYDYLNFIGTKKKVVDGVEVGFEGYGGWTWGSFCSENSPFYDSTSNQIDFQKYCENNNYEDIDIVYILLTWNGHSKAYNTEYDLNKGHFAYAQQLIDRIHYDYPNAIIRCMGIQMPSQNGGMGTNYNSSIQYGDAYGMLVTAMHYNYYLEQLCALDKYKEFVRYIDIAGQFDTDYNMPKTEVPVNNRNPQTETMGTNGVHPSMYGYLQIGDAVYRSLCNDLSSKYQIPTVEVSYTLNDNTLDFVLTITDPNKILTIKSIELIEGDNALSLDDLTVRTFNNLNLNSEYTLKVTYQYDLGNLASVCEYSQSIKITT